MPLSSFFTLCLQQGLHPNSFSTGTFIPVDKKYKDLFNPNNCWGIMISPILAKIYEHIIDGRKGATDSTNSLQFGFTKGHAPTMAALMAIEAQAENNDQRHPTYMASLGMQKALDVDKTHWQCI